MLEPKFLNNQQLLTKLQNVTGGVKIVDKLPPVVDYKDGDIIFLHEIPLIITPASFSANIVANSESYLTLSFYDVSIDDESVLRGSPEVVVDWGDGTITTNLTSDSPNEYSHTYLTPGNYVFRIATVFDLPKVALSVDYSDPIEIISFGDLKACSYRFNCPALTTVPTTLPSTVTNCYDMFRRCANLTSDLSGWDTSNVTTMYQMFMECTQFNSDISTWDVSNVTNMSFMFGSCQAFNQSLNAWNVSKVTDMSSMFSDCTAFNSPLGNWSLGSIVNMESMFYNCENFNQDLSTWSIGTVTNLNSMFAGCTLFNQPLNTWDVSRVTDMSFMFNYCTNFNQPLSNWSVGAVSGMVGMFAECTNFDQDISTWTSQLAVKPMDFDTNTSNQWFNSEKPTWGQSSVVGPTTIFKLDMTVVPEGASPDKYIFLSSGQNNGPGIGSVGDYWVDWGDGSAIEHLNNSQATHYYSTNSVFLVKITGKVETLSFSAVEWPYDVLQWGDNVADGYSLTGALGSIPTSMPVGITTGYSMFSGCTNFNQDLSGWDTSAFTNMFRMFYHCTNFNQDISGWDVSNVTDMESMFSGCTNFNQPLNNWDVSKVTNMNWMFQGCLAFNQPLNNWNVGAVTSLSNTFSGCTNFNQPLNNWDVSNVTEIVGMFKFCTSFNQDLTDWALKPTVSYNDYDYYTPAWLANFKPI